MYKIGEFSLLNKVTIKTLRYYDDIGLFKPKVVDKFTGYRYYDDSQQEEFDIIIKYKNLGFTLDDIIKLKDNADEEIIRNKLLELKTINSDNDKKIEILSSMIGGDNMINIEFKKYNDAEKVSLSLGGIGKGYAIGIVKDALLEKGYTDGYLSGATSSNIILGNHYKNKNWSIGISSPSKNDFNLGGNLKLNGYTLISTSGDEVNSYGFYDENSNPVIRHHIIDATTGYPLNNFRKVTIVSKTLSSEIMDALSTILINTSANDVESVLKTMRNHYNADIEAIFQQTNANESEYYYSITKGLKDSFEINKNNPKPAKVYYYEF